MHRTVYLKTTETCNLNCKHCFTNGDNGRKIYWNHLETIEWIKKLNATLAPYDSVHFELHGGEPFLAPLETLIEVVDAGKALNERFSFAVATNLVYKLTDDIRSFIKDRLVNGISTSWDPTIRFKNKRQEALWLDNLKTIVADGNPVTLNISLSKDVIALEIEPLLRWFNTLGITNLAFERITTHGNTQVNRMIVPTNAEMDQWYVDLHEVSERIGARTWFHNSLLEDVYVKFEKHIPNSGTFFRACEERLFTVNADGVIAGCPNAAPTKNYGHIKESIETLMASPQRLDAIVEEKTRNDGCLTCDVFSYCGSGCYQLQWEGKVCPSPKSLMMQLAGIDSPYLAKSKVNKIIPIIEVR